LSGKGLKSTWSGLDDGSNKNSYEYCDVNTGNKTCGSDDNTQTRVFEKQPGLSSAALLVRSLALNSLPGDICGHCRKKCTPAGKLSEVI